MTTADRSRQVLDAAGVLAGARTDGAELIRDGANTLFRLPGGIVARVGRKGHELTARREVAVARWLTQVGLRAVQAVADFEQPTVVDGCPVTWWELLAPHRAATPAELGQTLKSLHSQAIPAALELPEFDPFEGMNDRVEATQAVSDHDRRWLRERLTKLQMAYAELPSGLAPCVVHGDAWQGNVAVPADDGPILLDFEHVSIGRPEWDLIPVAADHVDFARIDGTEHQSFVTAYGWDVTRWTGFRTLADIAELRWVCFAAAKADTSAKAARELKHRILSLRGELQRPWTWSAL